MRTLYSDIVAILAIIIVFTGIGVGSWVLIRTAQWIDKPKRKRGKVKSWGLPWINQDVPLGKLLSAIVTFLNG